MKVSIIIVNYKVKQELFHCLTSIEKSNISFPYEIIIVDNDEEKAIEKELKEKFPSVLYLKPEKNLGFGRGNNFGAKRAKGDYLFFLNPDTEVLRDAITKLKEFLDENKQVAIAAPLLLNPEKKPYPLQGTTTLNPLAAIVSLSFINKIFPGNPVTKKFWITHWDKKQIKEVDVVPGTAFMIRKNIFNKLEGFDEHFFLYFEENDLSKRLRDLGYTLCMIPNAKVIHAWGSSTKKSKQNISKIFSQSRFYYFKKHYGFFWATLVHFVTTFGKEEAFFVLTLLLAIFLRFYKIQQNFPFDGEVGDNLLDIKNAFIYHHIPLKGPPTSHPWLSFGPLFYWLYGPVLFLSQFNPVSHAYFAACIAVLLIVANFYFLKNIFSKHVAIISSFLITISPLYLFATRLGRFTFFVSLLIYPFLWLLYKILNGEKKYFFWLCLMFGIMLNFHYTPLFLIPVVLLLFFIKKVTLNWKDITLSITGFFLPLTPLLFYDSQHAFSMSKNLLLWIPYRILGFLGIYHKNNVTQSVLHEDSLSFLNFFSFSFTPTAYNSYTFIGIVIFLLILLFLVLKIISFYQKKTLSTIWLILIAWTGIGFLALFIHGSAPLHYFVPLLPFPIIFFSLFLSQIWEKKFGKHLVFFILILLTVINCYYLFSSNWFSIPEKKSPYDNTIISYDTHKKIAKFIVNDAKGKPYILKRVGYNDIFEKQFAQNYIYLLWWYGNEPVSKAKITYTIVEDGNRLLKVKKKTSKVYLFQNIFILKDTE
jgi:GT2 family glycosyltransferase